VNNPLKSNNRYYRVQGVIPQPPLRRLLGLPQPRKQSDQFGGSQGESLPAAGLANLQCPSQLPIPGKFPPGRQLVNREVQGDISEDDDG